MLTTRFEESCMKDDETLANSTRFEELCMKDDETLANFYSRLCDIANESFALGERIPESKLVWKIIRSLYGKFQSKVTAIEKSNNLEIVKIDELMGSLQTFELN